MNTFTAIGAFVSKPEMQYVGSDQKPMLSGRIELVERYKEASEDGGKFAIKVKAWGKLAETLCQMPADKTLLLSGALNMLSVEQDDIKTMVAELVVSEFQQLEGPIVAFNQVTLMGNVGRDTESMHFESGKNNAKTSLAVRRTKDVSDWFPIEAWGKTAEVMDKYVAKGSKIGITGSLKLETWTCKTTGVLRSKPVVNVGRLELLGSKKDADQQHAGYSDDF